LIAPAGCDHAGAHAQGRCSHSPDTINPIIAGDHFLKTTPGIGEALLTVIHVRKNDE